jgi:hypothetical protein
MSTPVNIPFEPHYRNDPWQGIIKIGPITVNDLTPTATGHGFARLCFSF